MSRARTALVPLLAFCASCLYLYANVVEQDHSCRYKRPPRLRSWATPPRLDRTNDTTNDTNAHPNIPGRYVPYYLRKAPDNSTEMPRILIWTTLQFYWFPDKRTRGSGITIECGDVKCLLTNDRYSLDSTEAVLFYGLDMDLGDMPPYRARAQKWVFWTMEAPNSDTNELMLLGPAINWTLTYRLDSDFKAPYGWTAEYEKPVEYSMEVLRLLWQEKRRMAVWPVSHCHTYAKRELFVRELRKHIDVDIVGKCGKEGCRDDCWHNFSSEYFFYLSFENNQCRDYVTEKLFNPLDHDIVPVVFGGVDYAHFAPRGSYVDALSFSSPEALARYLVATSRDFGMYARHFAWKSRYNIMHWGGWDLCPVCRAIPTDAFRNHSHYHDIYHWYNTMARCRSWDPRTFKTRALASNQE
ncbi:alpha-(1,3)-fucosyltransferase C-like [Dermacentor andersoni]|uniref:alpha-(1,3)-fucosyltransferase C-like n=1 Tax=Dermacentor andersoni TaxID=34620 RepID=UPI002155D325|nr:alpha-(1,3)-fucosyltransferase C-like [Dermacentor andersoni]